MVLQEKRKRRFISFAQTLKKNASFEGNLFLNSNCLKFEAYIFFKTKIFTVRDNMHLYPKVIQFFLNIF